VAVPAARRVLQWGLWRVEDCREEVWKWRGGGVIGDLRPLDAC